MKCQQNLALPATAADFPRLLAVIDAVLTVTRGDIEHPLAGLLHVLGTLAHPYEHEHDPAA
ncbi:MAG: hypothetical protein H0X24_24465 [Ktedonobacterales bacterium]|nr:hypothetical protein [Ktedonobacterales bacterium]